MSLTSSDFPLGFRIVGPCSGRRHTTDAVRTFAAYLAADPFACPEREAYLSAFQFDAAFDTYLQARGSVAGFGGPCWAPYLWLDVDVADDLEAARHRAALLAQAASQAYRIDPQCLIAFFSGAKGFHVGVPTAAWSPSPSPVFHRVARRMAMNVAASASVSPDLAIYDRVRALRAPNSRHPKTGLYKRALTVDQLTCLSIDEILSLAHAPEPSAHPPAPCASEMAAVLWDGFEVEEVERAAGITQRGAGSNHRLHRGTLEFIQGGAANGERNQRLYASASNLRELGASVELTTALLEAAALDSGLQPAEVRRTIKGVFFAGGPPKATVGRWPGDQHTPASQLRYYCSSPPAMARHPIQRAAA